jgi:hypothetical protein
MKIYTRCIPCFARQAVDAAEMATDDPGLQELIIRSALRMIAEADYGKTPPHIGVLIHGIVKSLTGDIDPYQGLKSLYNRLALEYYPYMEKLVAGAKSPLETAAKLAVAGNNIDFGIRDRHERIGIKEVVEETLAMPFSIDDFPEFAEAISRGGGILYAADNAGEIVFDRLLIEQIPDHRRRVTVAVKGGPVLNDATREDAGAAGLTSLVRVVDTGHDAPGIIYEQCSSAFREILDNSDLVISKGQGNYETLSECGNQVFFLLKAKCPVIARDLGVEVGDIVLKGSSPVSVDA